MAPVSHVPSSYHQSRNVALPNRIKCNYCNRVKPLSAYSSNQTRFLAEHISRNRDFDPEKEPHILCISCGPQPVVELQCSQCDKNKAVDQFNKTQRKKDEPWCEACMKDFREYEPNSKSGHADHSNGSDDSDASSDSGGNYDGAVSGIENLSTHLGTLTASSHPGTYASSTTSVDGGVRLTKGSQASTYVNSSLAQSETASASASAASVSAANASSRLAAPRTVPRGRQRVPASTASVTDSAASARTVGRSSDARLPKTRKPQKSVKSEEVDIDNVQIASDDSDTE